MRQCSTIKADGSRCRAIALNGSDYCHAHAPDRAGQRSRAASKAGSSVKTPGEIATIKAELHAISHAAPHAESVKGYSVATQALNVYLRAIEVERRMREADEFESRLADVEAKLGGTAHVR